jgi:hypothetical protein
MNLFAAAFDQCGNGQMHEEDAMATLIKKTGSRIGRWFKEFREKNRSPYRWYENDVGLG